MVEDRDGHKLTQIRVTRLEPPTEPAEPGELPPGP